MTDHELTTPRLSPVIITNAKGEQQAVMKYDPEGSYMHLFDAQHTRTAQCADVGVSDAQVEAALNSFYQSMPDGWAYGTWENYKRHWHKDALGVEDRMRAAITTALAGRSKEAPSRDEVEQ